MFEFVFADPFDAIVEIPRAMREVETRPEMECFDTGNMATAYPLMLAQGPHDHPWALSPSTSDTTVREPGARDSPGRSLASSTSVRGQGGASRLTRPAR